MIIKFLFLLEEVYSCKSATIFLQNSLLYIPLSTVYDVYKYILRYKAASKINKKYRKHWAKIIGIPTRYSVKYLFAFDFRPYALCVRSYHEIVSNLQLYIHPHLPIWWLIDYLHAPIFSDVLWAVRSDLHCSCKQTVVGLNAA